MSGPSSSSICAESSCSWLCSLGWARCTCWAASSSSRAACSPSSCLIQLSPPSCECSTTPACPTAQPCSALGKTTRVRVTLTGEDACRHDCPLSSESRMKPRSPTATSRWPASATSSMSDLLANALGSDGCWNSWVFGSALLATWPITQALRLNANRAASLKVRHCVNLRTCTCMTISTSKVERREARGVSAPFLLRCDA
ncbi:hypothetical protein D9M70_481220 [compost metagenome]